MEYQFKTNINCGGCIAKVAPFFNGDKDVKKWKVNTSDPAKILTVETDSLNEAELVLLVKKAGFTATSANL